MSRRVLATLHKYAGLYLASHLALIGLAGSLCVYFAEIDRYLTPELHHIRPLGVRLDPATLIARAEALAPQAQATDIILDTKRDDTTLIRMEPRIDSETGKPFAIDFTEMYLDPYSGEERGRRAFGDLSQGVKNLMPFIYRFHYSLAMGTFGVRLLGISALIWTIDCFVGFLLTLPASAGEGAKARRSWPRRWWLSWRVKFPASVGRVFYDVHRAGGLWLWALLLVFAWSSVSFNLRDEVYTPIMRVLFVFQESAKTAPIGAMRIDEPRLGWRAALDQGRQLLEGLSNRSGFKVDHETWIALDRAQGVYIYGAHSTLDVVASEGQTTIAFSDIDGSLVSFNAPSAVAAGDTVTSWLAALHKAKAFGPPYRVAVCLFGLALTTLSLTGVYVWRKRVKARLAQSNRSGRRNRDRRAETQSLDHGACR